MRISGVVLFLVMFTNSVVSEENRDIPIYAPIPIGTQLEKIPIQKDDIPLEDALDMICKAYTECYLTNHGQIPRLGDVDCSEIPESFEFAARELIYFMNDYIKIFDFKINSIANAYKKSGDDVRKLYKDCSYLRLDSSRYYGLRQELDSLLCYEFMNLPKIKRLAIYTSKKRMDELLSLDYGPNPFDEVD